MSLLERSSAVDLKVPAALLCAYCLQFTQVREDTQTPMSISLNVNREMKLSFENKSPLGVSAYALLCMYCAL
jgi:hypothetical protein